MNDFFCQYIHYTVLFCLDVVNILSLNHIPARGTYSKFAFKPSTDESEDEALVSCKVD